MSKAKTTTTKSAKKTIEKPTPKKKKVTKAKRKRTLKPGELPKVMGRPKFDGKSEEIIVQKLEEAFAIGCNDEEACCYADISLRTLYNYQSTNEHFLQRKEILKNRPVLVARMTVVKELPKNAEMSFRFLSVKRRAEFGAQPAGTPAVPDSSEILTEERKKEIAGAMMNWSKPESGDERDEDYEITD